MSVKEIKELVAKSTAQSEQLSLLSAEVEELKSDNKGLTLENCELQESCDNLMKEVKELKDRQQEVIERLQNEIGSLNKKYPCTVRLGEHCLMYARSLDDYDKQIGDISSEAIKEFADKTNKMITEIYNKHIFGNNDLEAEEKDAIINFSDDVVYSFNNLVKETVDETNEQCKNRKCFNKKR